MKIIFALFWNLISIFTLLPQQFSSGWRSNCFLPYTPVLCIFSLICVFIVLIWHHQSFCHNSISILHYHLQGPKLLYPWVKSRKKILFWYSTYIKPTKIWPVSTIILIQNFPLGIFFFNKGVAREDVILGIYAI